MQMNEEKTSLEAQKIEPCKHMEAYVSALSDGSLSGPARWFTRLHMLHCRKCRTAFRLFGALRKRLRQFGSLERGSDTLAQARRSALENALDEVDNKRP